jgi:hypothetical protein
MPRLARTQGCPKQPVPPFPTRSNTRTASYSERFLRHLSILSYALDWVLSCQPFGYPTGSGSAQIGITGGTVR